MFNPISRSGALWLPTFTRFSPTFFDNIHKMSFQDISYHISCNILHNDIDKNTLKSIIHNCYNFDIPLKKINDNTFILELFHGPTLTFKDFGARFMSMVLKETIDINKNIHIIVSTSGDTGSAVADAFKNYKNVFVHILYPKNLISDIQKLQMTTYGDNITAYEVDGNFDDCQKLVKKALTDKDLLRTLTFFPGNSINPIRLIPQTFYYFWAYAQLKKQYGIDKNIVISVPSGNLGNLSAGLIAYQMGLPISNFIGATNVNDTFTRYIKTGKYTEKPMIPTISNAMDVSIPNNLQRINSLFDNNIKDIQEHIKSYSVSDLETEKTIISTYKKYDYVIDPHTAVGLNAFQKYSHNDKNKSVGIVMSTAHCSKFPNIMNKLLIPYKNPDNLNNLHKKSQHIVNIPNDYDKWKKMLIKSTNKKNISFIGMPGAGKSHIGSKLSEKINWNHIDIDHVIQDNMQDTLSGIIKKHGNEKFKKIEENYVCFMNDKNTVYSPGGSVVYSKKSMDHLKNISLVIYLDQPFTVIQKRLGDLHKRGVVLKPNQTLYDLYNERKVLYDQHCHININCEHLTDEMICNEVIKYIKA